MHDYTYPSSTIYAQSSSYFTSPIASMPSTLPRQHSIGDIVSNFIQPIENKLSQWFWQGINTLPQNYFSKDITKVNYFDKSLWQGIFNERLESLKEQLVSELTEQQSLPLQNNVILAKIDKLKEQIVADLPQDKFLLEEQLIYLQGIVGKYMLSPQSYEEGLDYLKQVVADNEQYITTIEKARSIFRSELKNQPALLAECLQGDVLNLFQVSPQNSLIPTPLKKILSYYKPLMAHKSYVRHQNWLQECYNTQSLLPPPAIKRHATTDASENEKKEENVTWKGSIRNLGKLLWEHAGKLITLGLATQVTVAQASGTNVTQQNSRLRIGLANRFNLLDTLERVNQISTNNTKIFALSFNISTGSEFDQYIEFKQELKQEILYKFDKINDDLHALIATFSADTSHELLESKSSHTVLSRIVRSHFGRRQQCNISKDKLTALRNGINNALLGIATQSNINCEFNDGDDTKGCDELIQRIACGIDHLKHGFIKANRNEGALAQYNKLQNDYNNLFEQFQTVSDAIKQQVAQEYQQKLDKASMDFQELSRSLNSIIVRLKENIRHLCISEIGHGHIDTAISQFKALEAYGNGQLLHDIIETAYANYGQLNNFDNIINFITRLPWFSDIVISYEALYEKMDNNSPKALVFAMHIQNAIENTYLLNNEQAFIPRLNTLKSKVHVNHIIDAWAHKIRNNDYQQIREFATKYIDAINANLDRLIEKAYGSNLENAETIIKFIRDLPNITNGAVALSSLFKQMQRNNHLDSYELLMLVHYVKELMEMDNYPNVSQDYKDKFITLKNDLPRSVRRLIWNGNACTIQNRIYDKYLDTLSANYACNMDRRPVFTSKYDIPWKITPMYDGASFTMQSTYHNSEYLYAADNGWAQDSERRKVFTWCPGGGVRQAYWRIIPVSHGEFFIIRNTAHNNEYLYPFYKESVYLSYGREVLYVERGHTVFTWRKPDETPTLEGHWKINC